jgi:predicted metal-binding membrane protein
VRGAIATGAAHGRYCIGCCWAMMAALMALGVMSVTWMAVIAAGIAFERIWPSRAVARRGVAVALVALGIGVALAPQSVPGFSVPAGKGHGGVHMRMQPPM